MNDLHEVGTARRSEPLARIWRWILRLALVGVAFLALGLVWFFVLSPRVRGEYFRARVKLLLDSQDAGDRREAARLIGSKPDPFLVTRISQAIYGDERDPGVAAAYVEVLGRIGDRAHWPAVRYAVDRIHPGEVRAAGWLAAAQLDRAEFEKLAREAPPGDDWQALGIARGRLTFGDPAGVAVLIQAAAGSDPVRARLACASLNGSIRPLLTAIGHWPVESPPIAEWPGKFAAEIGRRAEGLDLAAIGADTQRARDGAEPIRSTLTRIRNARERIARWLTDPDNTSWLP